MGSLKILLPASGVLLLTCLSTAGAQTETRTYALKDALQVCARVQDASDRLACFEQLAQTAASDANDHKPNGIDGAPAPEPVTATGSKRAPKHSDDKSSSRYVVMRAEDYEEKTREAAPPDKATRTAYEATVLRAREYGNGEYQVALTNGEIWKSQARAIPRPVKDGEKVELQPGAIGSWFMRFKTLKRPAIQVTRIE
jgi:hypothetical protein